MASTIEGFTNRHIDMITRVIGDILSQQYNADITVRVKEKDVPTNQSETSN